jgi:hypothetical protein
MNSNPFSYPVTIGLHHTYETFDQFRKTIIPEADIVLEYRNQFFNNFADGGALVLVNGEFFIACFRQMYHRCINLNKLPRYV